MCAYTLPLCDGHRGEGNPEEGLLYFTPVIAHISRGKGRIMLYGKDYLKKKLAEKSAIVRIKQRYYDMKNAVADVSGVIPEQFKWLSISLGWCAKAVDTLADRLVFDSFQNDLFLMNSICELNNPDVLFDSSIKGALISGCSFVYIGVRDGYPALQTIGGESATGIIDPITYMLREGYAVLERDQYGKPTKEAYFEPYKTSYFYGTKAGEVFTHSSPYPLLTPVIYRPDTAQPFGRSRITRCCMDTVQAALRTLRRSEVSAEFYSTPQKYVLGLSEDAELNNRRAEMSSFLDFRKDGDGEKPSVGQFQQQSMSPFVEQLRMHASVFAGETGLTLDDLGFTSANPSSYDAIRASHENLRLTARKAQRTFGTGFLNAAYLAACVRDNKEYDRRAFAAVKPSWQPVFEPDAAALGVLGDAILKINQAAPDFLGAKSIKSLTGLEGDAQ